MSKIVLKCRKLLKLGFRMYSQMQGKRTTVHHIEMQVKDVSAVTNKFTSQYGFTVIGQRHTTSGRQYLVQSGSSRFLISPRANVTAHARPTLMSVTDSCCRTECAVDTAMNVAVEVDSVTAVTERVACGGSEVLQEPTTLTDQHGTLQYSIVRSCVGDVLHTLLNTKLYTRDLLPGFTSVPHELSSGNHVTHMDHFVYVCRPGESYGIAKWYEDCFNMKRLYTCSSETVNEGLLIENGVNMRLMALTYRADDSSHIPAHSNMPDGPQMTRLVLAEPLPGKSNRHLDAYLREHGGPGLQHVGLQTTDIKHTVDTMLQQGVQFRKPPPTYYSGIGKLSEIIEAGENLDDFQRLGILLDIEKSSDITQDEKKYLMQVFTLPVFREETFFLEIIQRRGSVGFGSGNVTALARSIEAYEHNQQHKIQQ